MSRARVWGAVIAVVASLGQAAPAAAQAVMGPRGTERVRRGTWEIGTDQMLLLGYTESSGSSGGSSSELRTTWSGGVTPRLFVLDNLAIGIRLNAFYWGTRTRAVYTIEPLPNVSGSSTTWAAGFLGIVLISYYVHVAPGWFFKPGVGGGGYGGRFVVPGSALTTGYRADLGGGAVLVDLGFAWYASRHLSLRAGVELLVRAGRERPTSPGWPDHDDVTAVELGFGLGGAWSR
jgi:hypothetical protein